MKKSITAGFIALNIALLFLIGAYDGNGTFNRVHSWAADKTNSIPISSDRMDAEDDGFAAGLSNAITKDGQTTITADIPFSTQKITGLGVGTANTDSLTLGQAQNGGFLHAGTGGGTVDVITLAMNPVITAYVAGQKFRFLALGANTTTVTVNINSVGALALKKNGGTALVAGDIPSAGAIVEVVYDGTDFEYSNVPTDLASPETIGDTTPGAANFTTIGITTQGTGEFTSIGATTAGTLKGTTIQATTSLVLATGATVTAILDEDAMGSNSATALSTQQSIKAYVDNTNFTAATQAEQETGTSLTVGVTPGRQQFHQTAGKAWVVYNHTTATVLASYNVTSVTDGGTGIFTVNWSITMSSTSYVSVGTSTSQLILGCSAHTTTTTGCTTVSDTGTSFDATHNSLILFGDI